MSPDLCPLCWGWRLAEEELVEAGLVQMGVMAPSRQSVLQSMLAL